MSEQQSQQPPPEDTAAFAALHIEGLTLHRVALEDNLWQQVVALRKLSHYRDCWEGIAPRDDYDRAIEEFEVKPYKLGPQLAAKNPDAELWLWMKDGAGVIFAAISKVTLAPLLTPGLWVPTLYLPPDDAGTSYAADLAQALKRYAQVRECAVLRVTVFRHASAVWEEIKAVTAPEKAWVASFEGDCVL